MCCFTHNALSRDVFRLLPYIFSQLSWLLTAICFLFISLNLILLPYITMGVNNLLMNITVIFIIYYLTSSLSQTVCLLTKFKIETAVKSMKDEAIGLHIPIRALT